MVLIKVLTVQSWKELRGQPLTILVSVKKTREWGIVTYLEGCYTIHWNDGYWRSVIGSSVGDLLEQGARIYDFFYVEIKP
jgi:hypothetical protein